MTPPNRKLIILDQLSQEDHSVSLPELLIDILLVL